MKKITMFFSAVVLTIILTFGVNNIENNTELSAETIDQPEVYYDPIVPGYG